MYNADIGWIRDLRFVYNYGMKTAPRGMNVWEVIAYQSVVNMNNPIIYNIDRNLGYKFMAAEAAWILDGRNDVDSIKKYSKDISNFSDNGKVFFGAYGPPINDQIKYVFKSLVKDPDTRQAVLTIWRQNPKESKDIPCTVSLQWLIREQMGPRLHCVATMRSSDLWLGHVYDIFNFSAITFALMIDLNIERSERGLEPLRLGDLHLTAGSKHIYERNAEAVEKVLGGFDESATLRAEGQKKPAFILERYLDSSEFVEHLWQCAEMDDGAKYLVQHID